MIVFCAYQMMFADHHAGSHHGRFYPTRTFKAYHAVPDSLAAVRVLSFFHMVWGRCWLPGREGFAGGIVVSNIAGWRR